MKLLGLYRRVGLVRLRGKRDTEGMELVFAASLTCRASARRRDQWRSELHAPRRMWALAPKRQTEHGLSSKGLIVRQAARRCAAAARQVPATDAPALRSAAYFPRASDARALRPRPCARRTSPSSAHARPSHYGVRGNSSSWRSPPSTIDRSVVRSLHSRCDCHHKNALFTVGMGCLYSTAGVPAPTTSFQPCHASRRRM